VKPEPRIVEITIEKLAAGGDGFGRVEGKACFVPLAAPGDRIVGRVVRETSSYLRARIESVEQPGPGRREPPCEAFGRCGGCNQLHLTEAIQIDAKARLLRRALGEEVRIVQSPRSLGYRCLARMRYRPTGVRGQLGFFGRRGRRVVDLDACSVLAPALEKVLGPLRDGPLARIGRPVDVRLAAGEGGPSALVEARQLLPPAFYESASELVPEVLVGVLAASGGVIAKIAGKELARLEGADGRALLAPVGGFGQANPGINRLLGSTLAKWVAAGAYETALELYAGAGNFTVAVAGSVGRVWAVELDERACRAMRGNLEGRSLKRVEVVSGDALGEYRRLGRRAELVILDPPRTGARELCRAIGRGDHRAVIYVSCDPASLKRDLVELWAGGYRPVEARGFDMFPQTAHVEALVRLERN
jgi:23S rRNA (uracil1939-C5)-methyltransferase